MDFLQSKHREALEGSKVAIEKLRDENRNLWGKIIVLNLQIVGFSITLFATDFLSEYISDIKSLSFFVVAWFLYLLSVVAGLVLLKKESRFQVDESTKNLLYSQDQMDLLDSRTLKTKDKDKYISLLILHSKRDLPTVSHWSSYAISIFEKNKKSLFSWKYLGDPENFFNFSHKKQITDLEKFLFVGSVLATCIFFSGIIFALFT